MNIKSLYYLLYTYLFAKIYEREYDIDVGKYI